MRSEPEKLVHPSPTPVRIEQAHRLQLEDKADCQRAWRSRDEVPQT